VTTNIKTLVFFVLLTLGGGLLIGFFNIPGDWYRALVKPSFNPPNWIFGPVWTILYIMIGIAGAMLWDKHRQSTAMKIWWVALVLNFLWSPTFFGMQQLGLALVIIVALLASILAFIATARKLDGKTALLFVPYAAWVGFATLLNASLLSLNG
jgi:translocator protein